MSTYVIGDLQGCLTPLLRLLEKLDYDDTRDRLWFVGDIVNRGPESLEALRFVKNLGDRAITVLGNHDLHLIATRHGVRKPSRLDTLDPILNAPDADELEHWLRQQPLLHHDEALNLTLAHAGIYPLWSFEEAVNMAKELHELVSSDAFEDFLPAMYGNRPTRWDPALEGTDRLRFGINAFTRMRMCTPDGELDYDYSGPPQEAPEGLLPWYLVPNRVALPSEVVFGHWSAHPAIASEGVIPTDRGCVWGNTLAAYDVERRTSVSVFNR